MRGRLTARPKCRQTMARQAAPQSISSICQTSGKRRVRRRPALAICHGRQNDQLRLLALVRGLAERAPPTFA